MDPYEEQVQLVKMACILYIWLDEGVVVDHWIQDEDQKPRRWMVERRRTSQRVVLLDMYSVATKFHSVDLFSQQV